jgi:hypothetical protein
MTDRTLQFEADFESPTHHVAGTSTSRRPDAVSPDYLTAWSLGPAILGDPGSGYDSRCWYAVFRDGAIYLAVATADNSKWQDEQFLTDIDGEPPVEISLAFTTSGWPVIAMERNTGAGGSPEVWLLWRDPVFA